MKQIHCISLNMLDRRQSRVLEINRYSICIFFPPHLLLSVPITTPSLCGMCATVAAGTCRQNELVDAVAMGGLVEPESQRNSES